MTRTRATRTRGAPLTAAQVEAAAALHAQLQRWLEVTHGDTDTHVVATALSYEIGRVVGLGTLGYPDAVINECVEAVAHNLRQHILAVRKGLIQ